jgi:hypothetical protein
MQLFWFWTLIVNCALLCYVLLPVSNIKYRHLPITLWLENQFYNWHMFSFWTTWYNYVGQKLIVLVVPVTFKETSGFQKNKNNIDKMQFYERNIFHSVIHVSLHSKHYFAICFVSNKGIIIIWQTVHFN